MNYEDLPEMVRSSKPNQIVTLTEKGVSARYTIFDEHVIREAYGEFIDTERILCPKPPEPEIKPMSSEDYLEYLKQQYIESVESGDVSDMRESALELADFICETESS